MARITVSLPEDLAKVVENLVRTRPECRKRSHLIMDAVKEYVERHYPEYVSSKEPKVFPSVLSRLEGVTSLRRGPSLTIEGRKSIGGWVYVE